MAYTRVWPEGWKDNEEGGTYIDAAGLNQMEQGIIDAHTFMERKDNPHNVTKTQVGLGDVPNVATNDQVPTWTEAALLTQLSSGEKLSTAFGKIAKAVTETISQKSELAQKVNKSSVGVANGVAALDSSGTVPAAQLPSYVDDVVEGYYRTSNGKFYKDASYTTEIVGETGKIYVSIDTSKSYRWTGSTFAWISNPVDFDSVPTQGSTNAVTSGGVYNADQQQAAKIGNLSNLVTEDKTNLVSAVNEVNNGLTETLNPPLTASGSVVTFTSAAAGNPINPLIVNIELTQSGSGDPSPTNVRPITGWTGASIARCGKNMLEVTGDTQTINGVTFTTNKSSGTITVNGTASAAAGFGYALNVSLLPGTYILNGCPSGGGASSYELNVTIDGSTAGREYGQGLLFTVPSNARTITSGIVIRSGVTVSNLVFSPMIRLASDSDATFEPYKGNNIYNVSFSSAGTVYGGTLDVTRGLLTVERGLDKLTAPESLTGNTPATFSFLPSLVPEASINVGNDGLIFDRENEGHYSASSGRIVVYGRENGESAATFLARIGGELNAVYKLATPTTYQLTPQEVTTLLGINNIMADCGDVDVTYRGGENPAVLTVKDIGVAGGAASYEDVDAYRVGFVSYGRELPWTWMELRSKIRAGDFSGIRIGDFKTITLTTGEIVVCEVAGIDQYCKSGSSQVDHHIDFISRDCLSETKQYNATNNNNGTATEKNPWRASALFTAMNDNTTGVYATLPADLRAVIIEKVAYAEERYSSAGAVGDDTGWGHYSLGKLWLPSEVEVFGSAHWSEPGYGCGGYGVNTQYPIFIGGYKHIIKGNGRNGIRHYWWELSAARESSTHFCHVGYSGNAITNIARSSYCVPLCFRVG